MRIVIVEDEDVIREGIAGTISKINQDYQLVRQAIDGISGLEMIERVKPDLIITDIRMPKMDGLKMLKVLKEKNINAAAIILSAYSEFKYAQKAIVLGVEEYLLKPIALNDLASSLLRIETKLKQKQSLESSKVKSIYSLDDIFMNAVIGNLKVNAELSDYLLKEYEMHADDEFVLLNIYMGEYYEEKAESLKKELVSIKENNKFAFKTLPMIKEKSLLVITYKYDNCYALEKYFARSVIPLISSRLKEQYIYCLGISKGLHNISDTLKNIKASAKWNFVLKEGTLISDDYLEEIKTKQFLYPINIEKRMKEFIIKKDIAKLKDTCRDFKTYCVREVYDPESVKKGIINFALAAINTAKEVEGGLAESINVKVILNKVIESLSWHELENLFAEIFEKSFDKGSKGGASLLIKRTESLIQEYYNQGIKLEEIAQKLNVTPDYLGKMFKKEVGESFNSYVKKYRINKVKTLLLGTELKIYEIAELTGYADGKYMSQVFKESMGCLPNEYRKLNR